MAYLKTIDYFSAKARKYLASEGVATIFEIGARDCNETLGFHKQFPAAQIFTFECNPDTLDVCRARVGAIPQIKLIEKAVSDNIGKIKFYPIDTQATKTQVKGGNPGASSLLQANPDYPEEKYVQREIEVETTTLQQIMAENQVQAIDLLWMDIQGAELMALRGLGERINDVKMMHLEVEFFEIYKNQPLFAEIKKFLNEQGFNLIAFSKMSKWYGDAIFLNRKYMTGSNLWANFVNNYLHIIYKPKMWYRASKKKIKNNIFHFYEYLNPKKKEYDNQ